MFTLPASPSRPPPKCLRLGALAAALLVAVLGTIVPAAAAAPTPMVDLGAASTYAVLSGASVGNTVSAAGAPHTTLRGDLGVKVAHAAHGLSSRRRHRRDPRRQRRCRRGPRRPRGGLRRGRRSSGGAAWPARWRARRSDRGSTPSPARSPTPTRSRSTPEATRTRSSSSRSTARWRSPPEATSCSPEAHGHRACSGRSTAPAPSAPSRLRGNAHRLDAVAVGNGTIVNGRAFARNGALTLDANEFYSAPPVVTIAGGGAITTDTTPTISGTTDVEAPALVTVTVDGQTLTATPVRRRMVGDLGAPGERHLPGRRLGHRRGGQPRRRHAAADRRHGPAGRHASTAGPPSRQRPDADCHRRQRRGRRHGRARGIGRRP